MAKKVKGAKPKPVEPSYDETLNKASEVAQICSEHTMVLLRELCMEDGFRAEALKRVRQCVVRLARNKKGFGFLKGAQVWMEPYIKKLDDQKKSMNQEQASPTIFIKMKIGSRTLEAKVDIRVPTPL